MSMLVFLLALGLLKICNFTHYHYIFCIAPLLAADFLGTLRQSHLCQTDTPGICREVCLNDLSVLPPGNRKPHSLEGMTWLGNQPSLCIKKQSNSTKPPCQPAFSEGMCYALCGKQINTLSTIRGGPWWRKINL